ncbi:Ger(x)C family spore germination protein [Paenibacillus sp. N4]|nr:Ger(x)C family spore germination protein [Paenibacillus vietnamensis]
MALVLSMAVPLLTGCWDRLELEERAVVLGVSIDVAGEEAEAEESEVSHVEGSLPLPDHAMVRVGVQIALPGRIPLGPGESGGGKGDSSQTVWVIDVVGHSIDDAFMNLQQQVSSKLFFGHLRVIVISEALARRGMDNVNDYFRRNAEVRRMAWMIVSKGKALDLMKAAPKLERVPTLYLMSTLDEGVKLGKFPEDYIGIYWSHSSKKGQEGFLPYVQMKKEQNVEVSGLAYFRSDKMVGATQPIEIAGYLGLKGINPAGYRSFINVANNSFVSAATQRRSSIKLEIRNGVPHFRIEVALEVNIEEKIKQEAHITPEVIRLIQQKQEKNSTLFYENMLKKTQEKGSDIFGFGERVRAKKPGYWNSEIKTKEAWQRMYKDVTFDIVVAVNVRRIGAKAL